MPRIYAPVIRAEIAELVAARSVSLGAWCAAPEGLAADALEEAEYEALLDAAAAAGERSGTGTRRVVLAADVDRVPAGGVLAVGPRQVASLHVDETIEHRDEDLSWYDASEMTVVLDLL